MADAFTLYGRTLSLFGDAMVVTEGCPLLYLRAVGVRPTDRPVSGVCHARCHARMSRSPGSWPPRCSHRLKPEKWGFLDALSSISISVSRVGAAPYIIWKTPFS